MDLRQFYQGKKVLITGNTGFKGTWLSFWLESLGADVFGISVDVPSKPSAFEGLGGAKRFRTSFTDIRDLEKLTQEVKSFKPEILFHMAAQPLVRLSYSDPASTWSTNVMGTVNVLEAVRATPSITTAAVVSSDKCYENLEWDFAYRETDRLGGRDPYSASKAGTEIVFKSYYESFFKGTPSNPRAQKLLSFRAGNVIGGADWAVDRIVPDCIRANREGQKALIRSPNSTRPWQHVLEPLGGYLAATAQAASESSTSGRRWNGESFNFGPYAENSRTVLELVQAFEKNIPGFKFEIDPAAGKSVHEAKFLKVSFEKANAWMGWKPSLNFEETLKWTADGYAKDGLENHFKTCVADFSARITAAGWAKA